MDLETYRHRAEEFNLEVTREYYLNLAGLKDEMNTAPIVDRYSDLFTLESVRAIRALLNRAAGGSLSPAAPETATETATETTTETAASEAARRLGYLYEFAVDGYLGAAVKEESDQLATAESRATVAVRGQEVPYRYVPVLLANESDRTSREAMDEARNQVMALEITPRAAGIFRKLYATSHELGYGGYISLYRDIKRIDFQGLALPMRRFLASSETAYRRHLEDALSAHGIDPAGAKKHDLAIIFRAKAYDRFFPEEKAVPALKATLAGLGFDLNREKAVIIDDEKREKKSPRAFCAPIRVGEEVMLVIAPHGGRDDYDSLLHESGHAMHFARTTETAFEYRRLGDNSVTEAFAFLFHYLTTDPEWLSLTLGLDEPEYVRFAIFNKLYMLRRYSAKLIYELDLHRISEDPWAAAPNSQEIFSVDGNKNRNRHVKPSEFPIEAKAGAYQKTLTEALWVEYPAEHYLTDLDQGFYAAQYLRAWIFEAQLRAKLKEKFGRRWYRSPEAGRHLLELWRYGQKYTAEELARQLGWATLDPGPLIEEIQQALTF